MIIDLRYHIASLVAVFLALGLGILIGSSLLSNERLFDEQKKLVNRLELDLTNLRQENRDLAARLNQAKLTEEQWREFAQAALPVLVSRRLEGRSLAVIRTSPALSDQSLEALLGALRLAGAKVTSVTTIRRPLEAANAEEETKILDFLGLGDEGRDQVAGELVTHLSRVIAHGLGRRQLALLEEMGLVQLEGEYQEPADTVIFLGGGEIAAVGRKTGGKGNFSFAQIDLPLLRALRRFSLTLAGAEPTLAQGAASYIPSYRQEHLLTVDNVETIPGQVALVYALAGQKEGNFGVKETAKQFLPPLTVERTR